jgi:hypothetical protein
MHNEIESIAKNHLSKKIPGPNSNTSEFYQILKELILILKTIPKK